MTEQPTAIDLKTLIVTPENIRFEYRLAGPFRRVPALFIDFVIRTAILMGILMSLLFSGLVVLGAGAFMVIFMIIGFFLLTWFYGLTFECWMNGQTPGKRTMGLRVISIDGRPINAVQATMRNFIRAADMFPLVSLAWLGPEFTLASMPTFLVALVCMTCTVRMQRLGDLIAGTMVVIDEKSLYPRTAKLEDPRIASLCEFIPASFQMSRSLAQAVALYVDRRAHLPVGRRAELASTLGRPLLKLFDFREDTSPDLLLCSLYYRDFIRETTFDDGTLIHKTMPGAVLHGHGSPLKSAAGGPELAPAANASAPASPDATTSPPRDIQVAVVIDEPNMGEVRP